MSSKEIFTWDKRSNNLSECKGCQRIACNLFLIQPHENTCTCTFVIKNGMVNVAKMKRAFYSCYLVPKYNFTTSRDRLQNFLSVHLFYYQRTWSNTEQEATCGMYRNDTFPLKEKRLHWVTMETAYCPFQLLVKNLSLLMKTYQIDILLLHLSSC